MKNTFDPLVAQELINRINQLTSDSTPQWGSMNVAQMLAHCNVTYEMAFEDIHPKAKGFKKFILTLLIKQSVVGPRPYPKNGRTAPQFLVSSEQDFEKEKTRIIGYINKTHELGAQHFEGKESNSFGKLTSQEWNTMFYKHLDHHLKQFNV